MAAFKVLVTRSQTNLSVLALQIFSAVQGLSFWPPRLRASLWRLAGYSVGRDVRAGPGVYLSAAGLRIGDRVSIGARCHLGGGGRIEIGSGVQIAANVLITTSSHEIGPSHERAGPHTIRDVWIGDGCWLGAGVLVLPGIRLAKGCVVAAGGVVARPTEPDGLYGGVPAARLRDLSGAGRETQSSNWEAPLMSQPDRSRSSLRLAATLPR